MSEIERDHDERLCVLERRLAALEDLERFPTPSGTLGAITLRDLAALRAAVAEIQAHPCARRTCDHPAFVPESCLTALIRAIAALPEVGP